MSPPGLRPSRRRCRPGAAILIALAVMVVVATGSQALDLHEADTPGFYNAAHVLETLAAAAQAVPPTQPPPVPGTTPVATAAPSAPDPLVPAPTVRHAGPRAPPTT